MAAIRIGISGWSYRPWRGAFYPAGLPGRMELRFAAQALSSIEINASFYALQRPSSYARWYAQTPEDFVFALKGPRLVTHLKRLRGVEIPLANFFASGLFELKEKLGPILWQLPPSQRFEPERLAAFLALLPADTAAAQALARRCDARRMAGRSQLRIDACRPLRHALEVRHPSFAAPAFVELLRRHRIAQVVADSGGRWPRYEDLTADFVYLRLHGEHALYQGGYSAQALESWARRIACWSAGRQPADARLIDPATRPPRRGRDVYCYFDNDANARAPFDARALAGRLGLARRLARPQGVLP